MVCAILIEELVIFVRTYVCVTGMISNKGKEEEVDFDFDIIKYDSYQDGQLFRCESNKETTHRCIGNMVWGKVNSGSVCRECNGAFCEDCRSQHWTQQLWIQHPGINGCRPLFICNACRDDINRIHS